MEADQLAETTKLVNQIGQLRDGIVWAILIIAILGAVSFIAWIWISYKKQHNSEASKNARSKQAADVTAAQTLALRKLTDQFSISNANHTAYMKKMDDTIKNVADTMANIQGTISQIDVLVKRILEKQDGVASLPTSVMVVQTYFYKVLASDATMIVNKSLYENDYRNRAVFIANKVKTDIGKVMTSIKTELADLDLAFNASIFFQLESESAGERYILVDLIWDSIQGLFLTEQSLYNKWEEASYKIMNTIKDYFSAIRYENIEGTTTYARYDRNRFRTPTSLRAPPSDRVE